MREFHFLFLVLAAGVPAAFSHPAYFHERNIAHTCTEHPSKPAGGHLPPVIDNNLVIKATKKGQPVTEVCPGENYTLSVSFGGDKRGALVTVSGGTLKYANVAGCSNAMTTKGNEEVTRMSSRWSVPCSLLGRVEVKVTSSNSSSGPFLKGSSGFTVLSGSKCAGFNKKCRASSPEPSPPANSPAAASDSSSDSTAAAARGGAATQQLEGDAAAAAASGSAPLFFAVNTGSDGHPGVGAGTSGRMCAPSNLGYQCSGSVSDGVVVHYSYGGVPPFNVCTNKTNMDRGARNSSGLMHFAIETEQQGYVSFGFPLAPGRMVPSDVVLGKLDNATGVVKVATYRLTGNTAAGIKPMSGWATRVGAVRRYRGTGASSNGGSSGSGGSSDSKRGPGSSVYMLICFSRPAVAKASIVPNVDPSMVPVIWASHGKDSFDERHDKDGSLIINMLSGQHAVLNQHDGTAVKPRYIAHIAHGATMIAAFCLLMPAAGLISRHRWLFVPPDEAYSPTTGGGWLALHFFLQLFSAAAAIVSYLMAMLMWFRQHSLGFDRHLMYAPHCELGTGVMAMLVVQVLTGFMRSCLPERHWGAWKLMHMMWGWATVVAGAGNCVIGTLLMRDLLGMPWLVWLLPIVCSLGMLLLSGLFLEIPRMVRVREALAWNSDALSDAPAAKYRKSDATIDFSRAATCDQAEELALTPTTESLSPPRLRSSEHFGTSGGGLPRV